MNCHKGHRQRMLVRAKNGFDNFQEHEVLEVLLFFTIPQKDTNEIAHDLIDKFGSLANVLCAKQSDLMEVKGIGEHSANFFQVLNAFAKRLNLDIAKEEVYIVKNLKAAGEYAYNILKDSKVEQFYAIALDSKYRVIHQEMISEGTHNKTAVSPRKIVDVALRSGAATIMLAHNHPAGSLFPSPNDITMTQQINDILASMEIVLGEHFIICKDAYYGIMTKKGMTPSVVNNKLMAAERTE